MGWIWLLWLVSTVRTHFKSRKEADQLGWPGLSRAYADPMQNMCNEHGSSTAQSNVRMTSYKVACPHEVRTCVRSLPFGPKIDSRAMPFYCKTELEEGREIGMR